VRTTTARIATINIAKAEFGVASAVANAVVEVLTNAVEVLVNVVVEVLTNAVVEMPVTVVPAVTFCDPSMN
jgi:hypothetical protein